MNVMTLLMIAVVMGAGAYLILSSLYWEVLLGVALISNGVNLLLIESGHSLVEADPLPQAFILTAIVIGFSVLAFLSAYMYQRMMDNGSEYVDKVEGEEL